MTLSRVLVALAMVLMFSGCPADESSGDPCDFDIDCQAGWHCAPGGCDLECRLDDDCVGLLGPTAICTDRGRCVNPDPCGDDEGCQDGVFCNGYESCRPGDPEADARGCVVAGNPCLLGSSCSEGEAACVPCDNPDLDGDGFESVECGGEDCDDGDDRVNPGRVEVCDDEDVDEDCDPLTFGRRDRDGDGHTDWNCCNRGPEGTRSCGDDCVDNPADDPRAVEIHLTNPESCDLIDNNCNGEIDEGVQSSIYLDLDGDGYGATTSGHPGCRAPFLLTGEVEEGGDCDDGRMDVRPGASEVCNDGIDNNCNTVQNEGCGCTLGETQACGHLTVGLCRVGVSTCTGGPAGNSFGGCMGNVEPVTELCDRQDNDCDGATDEWVSFDGVAHPSDCILGPPGAPTTRRTTDACGVRVTDTCVGGELRCAWGGRSGDFASTFGAFGFETRNECANTYASSDGSVTIYNRPGTTGMDVCPNLFVTPFKRNILAGHGMAAVVWLQSHGCVRVRAEVWSEGGALLGSQENVYCDTDDALRYLQVNFTTPARAREDLCNGVRVRVHAVDIPASDLTVLAVFLANP